MTHPEAVNKLAAIIERQANSRMQGDQEADHVEADGILCELLHSLGYKDVVEQFDKIKKWYA